MFETFWKVKDGLFIATSNAAEDPDSVEYIVDNKVTSVINCAGYSLPNHWETLGVEYLTFNWVDAGRQTILDDSERDADHIFQFIEQAHDRAEGVVVQSVHGQSRSYCVVLAYLMRKYRWRLHKAMEFLATRRPGHKMQPAFQQQLEAYERRLEASAAAPLSSTWDEAECRGGLDEELRNTYLNARRVPVEDYWPDEFEDEGWRPSQLRWSDNMTDSKINKMLLEIPPGIAKHNAEKAVYDQAGRLILTSALKATSNLATSFSTAAGSYASASGATLASATPSASSSSPAPPAPPPPSAPPAAPPPWAPAPPRAPPPAVHAAVPPRSTDKHADDLKVFRFLLDFDPPALAIEWGEKRSSRSLEAPAPKCTRLEFAPEELLDVRSLADGVVREQPFLSFRHQRTVEALLQQLASQTPPLYRVIIPRGAALREQRHDESASAAHLPLGALVLAFERVRQDDGWWVRIWSGQWLHATWFRPGGEESVAEVCQPSADDAARWFHEASMSQTEVLLQNAAMVSKLFQSRQGCDSLAGRAFVSTSVAVRG